MELQSYAYINSPLRSLRPDHSQPHRRADDDLSSRSRASDAGGRRGVGYQAAILSELVNQVYSIELIEDSPSTPGED